MILTEQAITIAGHAADRAVQFMPLARALAARWPRSRLHDADDYAQEAVLEILRSDRGWLHVEKAMRRAILKVYRRERAEKRTPVTASVMRLHLELTHRASFRGCGPEMIEWRDEIRAARRHSRVLVEHHTNRMLGRPTLRPSQAKPPLKPLLGPPRKGVRHGGAILSDEDVRAIRRMRGCHFPVPLKVVAAKYGIAIQTVSEIARRVTWKHID